MQKSLSITEKRHYEESNEQDLFYEVYNNYGQYIKHVAFQYVKDPMIAEDIAQEVLFKVSTKIKFFNWRSSLKTWIYKLTMNQSIDYLRRAKNQAFSVNTSLIEDNTISENTPEAILLTKEDCMDLFDQIHNLSLIYKHIIYLYYFKDYTILQISQHLDININTVKTRLKRARMLLKEQLLIQNNML